MDTNTDNVLTIVAPRRGGLNSAIVARAGRALNALDAKTAEVVWLADEEAADLAFSGTATSDAEDAVRQALSGDIFDMVAQPIQGRRKRLFLADMDATIVTSETLDDLAGFVGLKDKIAAITARAMNGGLDFETAITERVAMLAGLPESTLEDAYRKTELTAGAETLVRTMAANATHCVLVSGGFRFFTSRVATACGFHEDHANQFIFADAKLTGEVARPILGKEAKLATLMRLRAEMNLDPRATMAVGDGANDLPMIREAGLGVAFHGKPVVATAAPARIDHGDLTALLFYQGYRRAEFAI